MAYREPHFWQHTSDKIYGTVHIHVVPDASEQKIIAYVSIDQFNVVLSFSHFNLLL